MRLKLTSTERVLVARAQLLAAPEPLHLGAHLIGGALEASRLPFVHPHALQLSGELDRDLLDQQGRVARGAARLYRVLAGSLRVRLLYRQLVDTTG
jgi:hypothetical protein